ncbi:MULTISPECIES: symmetrical bis(5'-nucleosyl)-tetraphosphatase [Methylomonas]|uniref:Bis(5'-nucleosyl)-tetraphosphatase (Symmetrical) n=2 Tax=Methylomonas TaxID=416 RepID=A0A126T289_9GAMM|nr:MULTISPECIES: symmetrical bis(5'-nucleosyl)-tetraphosphatase [Methylomonas]AMK76206.1 bis(5'-nucleosyl)-tetraphosphatase (symmetrical) [Methylomonas denitrificans]OAI00648.1 bis(5'-nucleosyl)-tetraphosphatase (symmetrical) [Methylomonas methanica]TCV88223.1 bis(5'-nucleosyl)-tetraphosphatase (symmetrical) [Methylomonas methanica]
MTTYAIGSVNGNYQTLMQLVAKVGFDPREDRLWFAGNLVNQGPESLQVLRYVKSLGKTAVAVLGKQELHLLSVAQGYAQAGPANTLDEILTAPDRDELLKWLRLRSLIHHDSKLNFTLVNAGLPGEWTFSQALTFAYEVESVLSGSNYAAFLENRKQDQSRWHAKLRGWKRLNFIANAYTQMAYCNEQGKLDFKAAGPAGSQSNGLIPWYRVPNRLTSQLNVVFADDVHFADSDCAGFHPLAELSALKLSTPTEIISVMPQLP